MEHLKEINNLDKAKIQSEIFIIQKELNRIDEGDTLSDAPLMVLLKSHLKNRLDILALQHIIAELKDKVK